MTTDFGEEIEEWPQLAQRLRLLRQAQLHLRSVLDISVADPSADAEETEAASDDEPDE